MDFRCASPARAAEAGESAREFPCDIRMLSRTFAERVKRARLSLPVLCVCDLFHPIDDLAVKPFLNRDVRHAGRRCSPMPVLLAGGKPHHVAGANLLDRSAFALGPATAGCHDESLSKRMRMPGGARTRFERHACA